MNFDPYNNISKPSTTTPNEMNYIDSLKQHVKIIDVSLNELDNIHNEHKFCDNVCVRITQRAEPYVSTNTGFTIENMLYGGADTLDRIFIVFGLCDDFNPENIDTMIDILGDSEFCIQIGGISIFKCTLSIAYFVSDITNEDILYIDKSQLHEQIESGIFNPSHHKYKYLLEKIDTDIKENKLLMIPICINVLIKNLPVRHYKYASTNFLYKYGDRKQIVSQFITNVYNINQTIFFIGNKNRDISIDTTNKIEIYCLTYSEYTNFIKPHSAIPQHIHCVRLQKYIIIKVMPDYEKIDESQWKYAVEQLPLINTIVYTTEENNTYDKSYTPNEIASVRRGKNCTLYALPGNPEVSMNGWISKAVKENLDGLKILHDKNYADTSRNVIYDETHFIYTKTRAIHDIIIHLEPSDIPVKLVVGSYINNFFAMKSNIAGTNYNLS